MKRVTVNLPDPIVDALKSLSDSQGVNMTEVLRRAISTEKFVHDTVDGGGKILIEEPDKSIKQLLIR